MIITEQFVYVHMPKTGGTFVSTLLRKIHEARGDQIEERRADQAPVRRFSFKGWINPRPKFLILINPQENGDWNQHGTTAQIPPEHRDKPILTTIRNPYDRYVSQYEFQWWRHRPTAFTEDLDALKAAYPHYPEITFADFIAISNTFFLGNNNPHFGTEDRLGRHTTQFIHYYYRDQQRFNTIDAAYLRDQRYREDLRPNLHFTFTENLNQQLYDFLVKFGYPQDEIGFIPDHGKIFPKEGGRSADQTWEKYYTPALKAWVRHHERMLFELFPHFDV